MLEPMNSSLVLRGLVALAVMGGLGCSDSTSDSSTEGTTTTGGDGGAGGGAATTTTAASGGGDQGGGGGAALAPTVTLTVDPTTMAAGATIDGTVVVENFILEAPTGQPNEAGHGHYHIYLDQATGTNYLTNGQTTAVSITIPSGTSAGAHTLRISLGQNGHAALSPPVEDIIDITVQ